MLIDVILQILAYLPTITVWFFLKKNSYRNILLTLLVMHSLHIWDLEGISIVCSHSSNASRLNDDALTSFWNCSEHFEVYYRYTEIFASLFKVIWWYQQIGFLCRIHYPLTCRFKKKRLQVSQKSLVEIVSLLGLTHFDLLILKVIVTLSNHLYIKNTVTRSWPC